MTATLRCLVVDDEPLAREGIANYVRQIDFLHLQASCASAVEAANQLAQAPADLLFLDIEMPQLSGIDFLRSLSHPPMVIFTTAYPEFAVESYQLDVLDYLLKPISFQRFFKAVNKAHEQFRLRSAPATPAEATTAEATAATHFFVKTDGRYERIAFADILLVEGLQNYVTIYTTSGKVVTLLTLKAAEGNLPTEQFLRVHKSFIVNKQQVEALEGNELLVGSKRVPVSRSYREHVLEAVVNKNLWKK